MRVFTTIIIIAAIAITEVTIIIVVAPNSCQNMEPTKNFDISAKFWDKLQARPQDLVLLIVVDTLVLLLFWWC